MVDGPVCGAQFVQRGSDLLHEPEGRAAKQSFPCAKNKNYFIERHTSPHVGSICPT